MKDLIMLNSKKEEKCNEECIVCEAPLVYLEKDELMECVLCHKKEFSKTRCQNGHYVCNDCHTKGMDVIISMCLKESSQNPIEIIRTMMNVSFCHMHGPEHHVMVGAALLTAYKNAGGNIELKDALIEMMHRGKLFRVEHVDSGEHVEPESVSVCLYQLSPVLLRCLRNHGDLQTK